MKMSKNLTQQCYIVIINLEMTFECLLLVFLTFDCCFFVRNTEKCMQMMENCTIKGVNFKEI